MKKRWIISLSFMAGILFSLIVPLLVLATGAINVGADVKSGLIEWTLAPVGARSVGGKSCPEREESVCRQSGNHRHGP